jgi:hypothetical protein
VARTLRFIPSKIIGDVASPGPNALRLRLQRGGASADLSQTFVEPTLLHRYGPSPEIARIILVSAPGAVGKSTYAMQICAALDLCNLDLARAGPVAEHSFIGGATRALGSTVASRIKNGEIGILIDALDEAQLKVPPESYQAFLGDIASSTPDEGPPIVLLGRTEAVEDASLYLSDAGIDAAVLEIQFFDATQSAEFVRRHFESRDEAHIASRRPVFVETALTIVARLREVVGGETSEDSRAFAGYAPVLEAVCKAIAQEQNPMTTPQVAGTAPIEILSGICDRILDRERAKICDNLRTAQDSEQIEGANLYSLDEQRQRLWAKLFGHKQPDAPPGLSAGLARAYDDAVKSLFPSHPFLRGDGIAPANSVFGADLAAHFLLEPGHHGAPLYRCRFHS